jgi:AraC family transcriptional regulator
MDPALPTGDFLGAARAERRVGAFVLGQWMAHPPRHHVKAHGHKEAHFMYVPPGTAYDTSARGARIVTGANLIYNPPQTWHSDRVLDHGRFLAITLAGEPEDLASREIPEAPAQIGNPTAHRTISRLIGGFASDALHLESLCFELLDAVVKPQTDEPATPRWLRCAIALLTDCRNRDHTVGSIAAAAGVHPVHLARAFRRFCGATPGQFLLSVRLDRAARLLAVNGLSVAEIALECGFADQSHLTRQFRRAFGMPPARFRTEAAHVAF